MREYLARNKVLVMIGAITLVLSPFFLFPIYPPFTPLNSNLNSTRIYGYDLHIEDSIAYIGTRSWGIQIVDLSQPMTPKIMHYAFYAREGSESWNFDYISIDYEDSLIYSIIREDYGYTDLVIVNVSSPMNPQLLGFHNFSLSSQLFDIEVANQIVFLGTSNGIYVYNIQDPANLSLINHQGNRTSNIILKTGNLLLSGENDLLCIYTISQFNTLNKISEFATNDTRIYDISVNGDLACVVSSSFTSNKVNMYLLDITTPEKPVIVTNRSVENSPYYPMCCYLSDSLYWGLNGQLLRYDISDLNDVTLIKNYSVKHHIYSISEKDNLLIAFNPEMIILSKSLYIGINVQSLIDFWVVMIIITIISFSIWKFILFLRTSLLTYPLDHRTNYR